MESFKDAKERTWTIAVDPVSVDLVRSKHEVDLYEVGAVAGHENPQESVEFRLIGDPLLFCKVVFELLVDRPDNVTFDDFARQIKGDSLQEAQQALWDEIVNFTPDPTERRVRKAMQEKLKTLMTQGMEQIHEILKSPILEQRLKEELQQLDSKFMNLLDGSGSTPGVSPPASSP